VEFQIQDEPSKKRYEALINDHWIYVEYIKVKDRIYLTHTEVPVILEGKGLGSKLVQQVLQAVKEEALPVVPLCPFVAGYIKRHQEWVDLLAEGYSV